MAIVTILMSVRNCAGTVGAAINSIVRQSFRDWDLVLLEDGSDDGTPALVRAIADPRVRIIIDGRKRGLIARLNQGIAHAQGQYIARMDGDDISYPDRLLRQVRFLTENPDVDLIGAGMVVFRPDGHPVGRRAPKLDHAGICDTRVSGFGIAHPTFMGKTSWFKHYGYRPGALLCEDQDLLLRSFRESRFANVPDNLLGYREGDLRLKKLITARYHFGLAVWQKAWEDRDIAMGLHGSGLQAMKALWETVALTAGLDSIMLRHRMHAITEEERLAWERVYAWATT